MFEIKNIDGLGGFLEIVHKEHIYRFFIVSNYIQADCCHIKYQRDWFRVGNYSIITFLNDNTLEDYRMESKLSLSLSKEQLVIIKRYVKLTFLN